MKKGILPSVVVALLGASYFGVLLPLQSFLPNADAFGYTMATLLGECAFLFAGIFLLLVTVLFALSRFLGLVPHVLVIAICMAALIETGPLSIGLPELNGEFDGYRSGARMIWDLLIVCVALAIPLIGYRVFSRHVILVAVAVAFYATATVFDSRRSDSSKEASEGLGASDLILRQEVVESSIFSANDNVFVLILDATSVDAARDVLSDKSIAEKYLGFVAYTNNVGMHWNTSVAIPGIMTGCYYESALELPEYGKGAYSRQSFIWDYMDKGASVYLNVGPGKAGYTNRPLRGTAAQSTRKCALTDSMYGQFSFNICELTAFRLLPYALKDMFLQHFVASSRSGDSKSATAGRIDHHIDAVMWPFMAGCPVSQMVDQTLHVHHTNGGHPPITFDACGNRIACPSPKYDDYLGQCKCAFKSVGRLFDVWRTNGVYDVSTIIMLGDHSASKTFKKPGVSLNGADPHSFPFLMVKPRGNREPFGESGIPTSHSKVAPLVRALSKKMLSRGEIEEILHQENRLCRLAENGKVTDWVIAADRSVKKTVREDKELDVKTIKAIELNKKYGFRIDSSAGPYPEFVVEKGNRNVTSGLAVSGKPMVVKFRMPEPNSTYAFDFFVWTRAPSGGVNHSEARCGSRIQCIEASTKAFGEQKASFPDVRSDGDGIVTFEFSCEKIGYANFVLSRMIASAGETSPVGRLGGLVLSFDDRRSLSSWIDALPLFKEHGARCTFFLNGNLSESQLKACRMLRDEGHAVGLHGVHHKRVTEWMREKDLASYRNEELEPQKEMFSHVGVPICALSYPCNDHNSKSDEFFLTNGFKRLRASVPDYSKQLKNGVRREEMDAAFWPVDKFDELKVMSSIPINNDIEIMKPILARAAERGEVVSLYSHAISTNQSNDVSRETLEFILSEANRLNLEFKTLED